MSAARIISASFLRHGAYPANHLSSRWNWKKTAGSRWTCLSVKVPLDYAAVCSGKNLWTNIMRPAHIDRQVGTELLRITAV